MYYRSGTVMHAASQSCHTDYRAATADTAVCSRDWWADVMADILKV